MGRQAIKLKFEEFSSSVKTARARMDKLDKEAADILSEQPVAMKALEELQAAIDEMETVEEELYEQYEELLATRTALEHEQARYRDLFDFAPDAYIVTDKNGIITEANQAACRLLKVETWFLVGKPLSSSVSERHKRAFRSELNRIATASDPIEFEVEINPRGDRPVHAALKVGPVRGAGGEIVALRWLIRDITERKTAEERIRRMNEDLERRVRERTAELEAANEMKDVLLARAQKAYEKAEAANRGKDEFLALVSHELRTPLNAVTGWIEILRNKPDNPELIDHALEVIRRNARAQAQIVNDILEASRMMSSYVEIAFRPVEIGPVIERAIDTVAPSASAKGVSIETAMDGQVVQVAGDPDRLQQIVQNLLSNGIKFTPAGGRVEVSLAEVGENIEINVSDTGKGINPDFLPYVFDRFSQADSSSTRLYGGLGLGLAIVRHLVELHGGTVRAESPGEDQGSTFIVSLPVSRVVQQSFDGFSNEEVSGLGAAETLRSGIEGLQILAVDDESDTLEMLKIVFGQFGARVTTASSCTEALKVIEESYSSGLPDILIADIAMPGQNGFDLIRKIRKMRAERGGNIPAIALTAYAGDEDRLRSLAEGFQIHLAKPVSIHELVSSVASLTRPA